MLQVIAIDQEEAKQTKLIPGGWTQEQSDKLVQLINDGFSYAIAAEKINEEFGTNYTRNSTIGRANRIGLKSPALPSVTKRRKDGAPPQRASRVITFNKRSQPLRLVYCAVDPLNISFADLQKHHCRFPYGDGPFTFCGHTKLPGSSYCEAHTLICRRSDGQEG